MEFYVQACIDLKLNEVFYVSKSSAKMNWNMADKPPEDFYQDGIETHVPGETNPDMPYEDRHIFMNYLVSGDMDSLDIMTNVSCVNGELSFDEGWDVLMSGPVGEIVPTLSDLDNTVEGEVVE